MKNLHSEKISNNKTYIIDKWKNEYKRLKLTGNEIDNLTNKLFEILTSANEKYILQRTVEVTEIFYEKNFSFDETIKILEDSKNIIIEAIKNNESTEEFVEEISEVYKRFDKIIFQYVTICNSRKEKLIEEKEEITKRLEINQQYLQNILHFSENAIAVIGKNEEFLSWNESAERIFGYTKKEILGKKSSFLLPEGKKYKDELKNIIAEVNKKGSSKIIDTERKTKAGEIIPVQLHVAKLPGKDNEYTGRTVVITDVREVRRLQQQVDQSEKLAVIGQLAAGVAHEIGNPLASISSLVQILQRRCGQDFQKEQLNNIKSNIDRISKIVRELVNLSRPPSQDQVFTQVSEVIKTALGIVKYDKRVKKVEFKTELKKGLPSIKIIPDQLLQVFINMLINSLDAIEGEGTITVRTSCEDDNIIIEIIDDGCGIPQSDIDKIFDPFYTTKEVGKGTGLGLSVSYGIVKKFNGNITVTSEVGKGSNFKIKIPVYKVQIK